MRRRFHRRAFFLAEFLFAAEMEEEDRIVAAKGYPIRAVVLTARPCSAAPV
jgi:hypothetical protein